ncbi:MAG: tetratricopeptide repeat protein [Litorimonas sp.]
MPNLMKPIFTVLLATTCLIAVPAQAQSKKELAAQNTALAERLERLESRMLTGDPAAERLMARIDALESAQRALRGELERVAYERDGLKGEVMQLRTELQIIQDMAGRMKVHLDAVDLIAQEQTRPIDRRVGPVVLGPTTPLDPLGGAPTIGEQPLVIGNGQTPPPAMPSNDVAQLGERGKRLLSEGDFAGAQTSIKQYLQFNPDAADIGEMNYYLGESYYVRGGYADAADAYIASMKRDPRGVKAPDAMVRLAGALRELGKTQDSCATLASLPRQYPNASPTVTSKAKLEAARSGC